MVSDREERDDEADAQSAMRVIEVTPLVWITARRVSSRGKSVLGYKQHAGMLRLVIAITTIAANCHDSKPLLSLLDKAGIENQVFVFMLTRRIAAGNIAML